VRQQKGIYDEYSLNATVSATFATKRVPLKDNTEVKL
jgi:hypothetical protein